VGGGQSLGITSDHEGQFQFYWIPGSCVVEVNERADSEASISIKEGTDIQVLLPVVNQEAQWKRKTKRNYTDIVKTSKGTDEKSTLKGTTCGSTR
jgi:hypothetical protein